MTVWAAFLRGINVGGHKPIKMAELRDVAVSLCLDGVQTVLQSGNLVFAADDGDRAGLATRLEDAIDAHWDFRPRVILRTAAQVDAAIARNPFAGRAGADPRRVLIMFLAGPPAADAEAKLAALDRDREEIVLDGLELHLAYPDGIGRSKLTGDRLERALGVPGTARNWNTLARVRDLVGALGA
jgi:uncharacterized protein (DUF1697 family)